MHNDVKEIYSQPTGKMFLSNETTLLLQRVLIEYFVVKHSSNYGQNKDEATQRKAIGGYLHPKRFIIIKIRIKFFPTL